MSRPVQDALALLVLVALVVEVCIAVRWPL